jgi:hypothetical protein
MTEPTLEEVLASSYDEDLAAELGVADSTTHNHTGQNGNHLREDEIQELQKILAEEDDKPDQLIIPRTPLLLPTTSDYEVCIV